MARSITLILLAFHVQFAGICGGTIVISTDSDGREGNSRGGALLTVPRAASSLRFDRPARFQESDDALRTGSREVIAAATTFETLVDRDLIVARQAARDTWKGRGFLMLEMTAK